MNNQTINRSDSGNTGDETGEYFQVALQNASIGMAVTDLGGIIQQANQCYFEFTGCNPEELTGKKLVLYIHPDDVDGFEATLADMVENNHANAVSEARFINISGDYLWARNSHTLIRDNAGNGRKIVIISTNINEEKVASQMAEQVTKRFRFLSDSMPQLIWTADSKGNIDYLSHAFFEYAGIDSKKINRDNIKEILFPEDLEITCTLWNYSVQTGEPFEAEHRVKRRDGSFTWQLSRAMPERDSHGRILSWLGSTADINRQKNIENSLEKLVLERTRDLQQANFNLEHSNQDLEQFAYIATHDLQEPLRKIRTYASWLNTSYLSQLPEEAQDYVLKIEKASERMSVLMEDLLNYSLLLRPQELFEYIDINLILLQVLKDNEILIQQKNAVINRMPLPVLKVIPMQIYQLFSNLLSNSLKFTTPGRDPVISIKTRKVQEEEVIALGLNMDLPYVEIVFEDNSIGFKQEYAEKIFVIFQRLNNRSKYQGTGIGLSLCKKIIQYHHGHIYARSEENEGTSIYMLLPA